jgi:hypothetical protein
MPKPAFDPTQPFDKMDVAKPAFDPNGDFTTEDQMASKNRGEAGMAALSHFGNGATLGYLPQIQAATEAARHAVSKGAAGLGLNALADEPDVVDQKLKDQGFKIQGPADDYTSLRDQNAKNLADQEKAHPTASLAGTIGGGLAGGIALNPLMDLLPGYSALSGAKAAKGAGLAAKAAALAQRTMGAMYGGAAIGAAANPGDTEGEVDPLQLGDRAKNATMSGMVSAPLHLGAEGVGAGMDYAKDKLKDFAETQAFRALGPFKRQAAQNADNVNQIGRTALDEGVIRARPTDSEGLADRAAEAKAAKGKELGGITDELAAQEGQATQSGMPRKAIADKLRERLLQPSEIPAVNERNDKMSQWIDEFEKGGDPNLTFQKLRDLKGQVGGVEGKPGLIKWDRLPNADVPLEEQFHRALYTELKNGEEAGAQALDQAYNGENSTRFQDAKQEYGDLKKAQKIAQNRANSDRANRMIGLTDTIAGGAGMGVGAYIGDKVGGHEGAKVGAAIGGGVGAMGNKLGRTYGNQVMAVGSDALSNLIAKSPSLSQLVQKYPGMAPALLQKTLMRNQAAPIQPEQDTSPLSPALLDKFKQNPDLVDKLTDPKLKEQIKNALERQPASKTLMHPDEARQQFLENN